MGQYGYIQPRKTPIAPPRSQAPSLAFAASGGRSLTTASNPFGLGAGNANGLYAPPDRIAGNSQSGGQFPTPRQAPSSPSQAFSTLAAQQQTNTAPTPNGAYDINTDPALLQIQAFTNMSDEDARAAADKQRRDLILAFGDPGLANSLGYGDLAAAAGNNPTSTKAQLGQQKDRKTKDLTEALNQANLLYGGYRVTQEQQLAQDYQNALAQAAAQVNAALGGIDQNLAGTLGANLQQRLAALRDAAARAAQNPAPPGAPQVDQGPSPFALPYSTVSQEDQLARLIKGLAPVGGW